MMNLLVNGERASAPDSLTVAGFLQRLGLPDKGVAVERNREIVPKSAYASTLLADGDRIEIVQFVGGG
jgi:thiamine biosynthesis protein ThiS